MFSLQFSITTITLLSITFIAVVLLLTIYRRRVASVGRHAIVCNNDDTPDSLPRASVIVYADIDTAPDRLRALLKQLLSQEYPDSYEVIVINDGSSVTTRQVVESMIPDHPNLYLSFTPDDTRNLSRRKLALTIGIKAARHDVVVLTCADTAIVSSRWLSSMTRHFARRHDIVIGYASIAPNSDCSRGRRYRAFDSAACAVDYLSAAIARHTFRGTGYNIAYRRSVFFDNKGFSRSLNLRYGDDDIFIDQIARQYSATVELSVDSHVEVITDRPAAFHHEMRKRRAFTHKFLRRAPRLLNGFCSTLFYTWLLASCAAIASAWGNLIVAIAVAVLALALWIPVIVAWRRTLRVLHSRRLLLTIPAMILRHPFTNLAYRLRAKRHTNRNYTWQ